MIKGEIKMKKISVIISTCLLLMITGCTKSSDLKIENTNKDTYVVENKSLDSMSSFEKEIQEEHPEFEKHDITSLLELNYHNEKSVYINVYQNNEVIYQLFRLDRNEEENNIKLYIDLAIDKQLNTVQYTGYWESQSLNPMNVYYGKAKELTKDVEKFYIANAKNLKKEDIENKDHIYLLAVSFDTPFDETNLQEDIDKRIENGDLIVTVLLDY